MHLQVVPPRDSNLRGFITVMVSQSEVLSSPLKKNINNFT